jgi:3-keto-disaccharide hydrolase
MSGRLLLAIVMGGLFAGQVLAAPGEAFTDPASAGPDFAVQGEYLGELKMPDQPEALKVGAQIIAQGDGKFHGVFFFGGLPGDGWERGAPQLEAEGTTDSGKVTFQGDAGSAEVEDGKMRILDAGGMELTTLKKIERKSPTLGAKPPEGAKVLFDGSSADAWKGGKITEDKLLAAGTTSKDEFGDFTAHLEFRTPFMPKATGQGRGNSGVYLQNRYECQVLDSFGLEGKNNECGGFYQIKEPAVNMCYPPLSWQTYDIDFTAARFDGDKKTQNAKVTIKHNGVAIFDNFELPTLTPGGAPTEAPGKGPFMLQQHGNPVVYRNVWVVEKKS